MIADPAIADLIAAALPARGKTLVMDCGAGAWAIALYERGADVCGADPSRLMLDKARGQRPHLEWVFSEADATPFDARTFAAVALVDPAAHRLTDQALRELRRVLKPDGRVVIFTAMAEQIRGYWLADYFPKAIARTADEALSEARLAELCRAAGLRLAGRAAWRQEGVPANRLLYCGKQNPGLYLDSALRAILPTFNRLMDPAELLDGLPRLAGDMDSSRFHPVMAAASDRADGDYTLLVLEPAGPRNGIDLPPPAP